MKLLFVEDDISLVETLAKLLRTSYAVDIATSFEQAEYNAAVNDYDLFIIDIMLPDGNGIDFAKRLRDNNVRVPILMLTGVVEKKSTVCALDLGADDYLTKPFSGEELFARLRALLRRPQPSKTHSLFLTAGDVTMNTASKTVMRQGRVIALRRKEVLLLEYLLRLQGTVVTRNMILEHIWESNNETLTNTVDVHINSLRRKLDKPFQGNIIKTVHGLGYTIES